MSIAAQLAAPARDITTTRILRLSVGIALALAFSQAVNWTASFITPVLASVILTLPLPAPSLKGGISFVLALVLSLAIGLLLLPMLHYQPLAGVLLVIVAFFACFLYGVCGGSPILSTFLLVGASIVPTVGSESIDGAIAIIQGAGVGAIFAVLLVWISFAIFPDPAPTGVPTAKPETAPPSNPAAARNALRSTAIVAPVFLWLLLTSGTASYAVVLIKVASMGQQASPEGTRAAGRDLMHSTLIGGTAAIVLWNVLQIWPTVVIYGALFLLCGLIMGPRIFAGQGRGPRGPMWSYALLTMMVVLAPGAADSVGGSDAGARFSDRIAMFLLATIYAVIAVNIFDRFWPAKSSGNNG